MRVYVKLLSVFVLFLYSCTLFYPPAVAKVISDNMNNTNEPAVTSNPVGDIITNHFFGVALAVDRNYGYWSTNGNSFTKFSHGDGANLAINASVNLLYYGRDDFSHVSSTQTMVYVVDTTVPTVTITQPSGNIFVNQNSYTVMGTAHDNVGLKGVYFRRNGSAFYQLDNPSNWSTNLTDLPEGSNIIEVYAKDISGNTGLIQSVVIAVHTGAPVVTVTSSNITNNVPIDVTLSVDKNYGYWSTNGLSSFVQFDSNTNVSIIISNNAELLYYGDDTIGNSSLPNTIHYMVDMNAPVVTSDYPNDTTNSQPFDVTLSVNENYGYWSTNGVSSFIQFLSNSSCILTVSNDTTTLYYYGSDFLDNTSLTQTVVYTIDTNIPNITLSLSNSLVTNVPFTLTLSVDKNYGYWSTNGLSSFVQFDSNTTVNLHISNDTTLYYYGEDVLGNKNATQSLTYTFDTTVPIISDNYSNTFTTNKAFDVTLTVSENYGYWSTNGSGYAQFGSNITFGITTNLSTNSLSYYGADLAGNTSVTQGVFYIFDFDAPIISVDHANDINFKDPFTVVLSNNEATGYWSTNGSANFEKFNYPATINIIISNTTTLFYYGEDSLNTSVTQSVIYMWDTNAPIIINNYPNNFTNNKVFDVVLSVDENNGYWSTNGSAFSSFSSNANTSITISNYTFLYYYGQDTCGNTSLTQNVVYTLKTNQMQFTAFDGASNDRFGSSVAVSADGNTFVVGSPYDDDNGTDSGSVYYFHWNGLLWQTNKFTASDGESSDQFGNSVAVSADGNTFVVGSLYDDDNGTDSGSVYYFHWNGSLWQTNKFIASDGANGDNFGCSVAVSADGNTFVVGSPYDNDNGLYSGSVYRFHWNGSLWQTNKFIASDGASSNYFGYSVVVSSNGNTFVVGSLGDDDNGADSGSVYYFHLSDSSGQTNKFIVSDGASGDKFGYSVAVSADGNTFVAGSPYNDSGSVYRFHWNGSLWQTNKFIASDGATGDKFGSSVAVSVDGNTFVVGSPYNDDNGSDSGSVYRCYWDGSSWQTNKITAYNGANSDYFGCSVSMSSNGNMLVIGNKNNDTVASQAGAVYRVFVP